MSPVEWSVVVVIFAIGAVSGVVALVTLCDCGRDLYRDPSTRPWLIAWLSVIAIVFALAYFQGV